MPFLSGTPLAVALWNGAQRDRDGRKGFSVSFAQGTARATAEGRTGTPPGEDPTDRVRAIRRAEPEAERRRETRDVQPHICGRTRTAKHFTVKRKTVGKRMRAKLQEIRQQLRKRMHDPIPETGKWLRSVVQGYFNYRGSWEAL
jgi:hypothetical protein